jgi:hypothetical protein
MSDVVEFIPRAEWEEKLSALAKSGNGTSHLPVPRSKAPSRQDVVNAFFSAFEIIGGVQRLAVWGNDNPSDFFKLYARLLPTAAQTQMEHSGEITIKHVLPRGPLDE